MAKKAYIGVANFTPRTLPVGYTQVEYIQSSGTQYIDTGVVHNATSEFVLQMDVMYDTLSPQHQLMGFTGNSANAIGLAAAAWWEDGGFTPPAANTRYYLELSVQGAYGTRKWATRPTRKTDPLTTTRLTCSYLRLRTPQRLRPSCTIAIARCTAPGFLLTAFSFEILCRVRIVLERLVCTTLLTASSILTPEVARLFSARHTPPTRA